MQKTKLGISVGLMGAAVYFFGLFGGYLVTTLAVAYILFFEENPWLKRSALKAEVLMIAFSVVYYAVGLIPSAMDVIGSLFNVFGGYFHISIVDRIVGLVRNIITFVETFTFIVLGLKALSQGDLKIPAINNFVNKNIQ